MRIATLSYTAVASQLLESSTNFFHVPERFKNLKDITFGLLDTLADSVQTDLMPDNLMHYNQYPCDATAMITGRLNRRCTTAAQASPPFAGCAMPKKSAGNKTTTTCIQQA